MTIETICVGTDFSPAADIALEQAIHIARHVGARVVLTHVGQVVELSEHPELREWGETAFRARRGALAAAIERHAGQGVELSQVMRDGAPAQALCEAASELDAGLVVVGSHGTGGALERFLLGSVAERVVRIADRPVLISRSAAGEGGFRKQLVAVDLETDAAPVLETALELVATGSDVELFHAWQLPAGMVHYTTRESPVIAELREIRGHDASVALNQLLLAHRKPGVHLYYEHAEVVGSPRDAILDRLDDGGYDLAVVGTHDRHGLRRWLAGSVAEGVARAAPCSVMVVKKSSA